ncbi:hypothetical protein JHK87_050843 [Glycine soja]|nr:hypothetical protein JHK87_050843 [Glycine soja]
MLRLAFPQIPLSRFISDSEAPNLRMVSSLSTFFLCTHSLKSPTLKPLTKFHCFARLRFRVPPKASSQNKNANTDSVETPSLQPSSPKPPYDSSSSLLRCFSGVLKFVYWVLASDGWLTFDESIVLIALPAALALAADPIASLIDTAFVGHIGAVELAAVGVSASGFNLVSKAFNVPLLNVTTSFVAEEQALIRKEEESIPSDKNVSTSLALAATLGMAETVVLTLGSGILMNIMGIPADSPMRGPAEQFLTLRAFGTPAIVLALAAQGTFRGFLDTKTPLYAVGNAARVDVYLWKNRSTCLEFVFVFTRYLIAFILLWKLSDRVLLIPSEFYGRKFFSYLKSAQQGPIPPMAGHQICMQVWLSVSLLNDALALAGQALLAGNYSLGNYEQASLVIFRVMQIGLGAGITLSMILFFGFGAFSSLFSTDSEVLDVARSGIWTLGLCRSGSEWPTHEYQLQTEILLFESISLCRSGSEWPSHEYQLQTEILLFESISLCRIGSEWPSHEYQLQIEILLFETIIVHLPGKEFAQEMNALAFVIDGIYYGVSDFGYAAYSMVLVGLVYSTFLLVVAPVGLPGVWTGLFIFMALRVLAGLWM